MSTATLPAPMPSGLPAGTGRPGTDRLPRASSVDLIVVGGVPGAGKTTAIAAATEGLPHVLVLDPEHVHHAIRAQVPGWMPYRAYRAIVHTVHTLAVVAYLLRGPRTGIPLIVHDPGTRRRRRRLFLRIADRRGWRSVAVYVDVDRAAARTGQLDRGRALRAGTFGRHWDRWEQVRTQLDQPSDRIGADHGTDVLVIRSQAAAVIRRLCRGS